MPSKIYLSVTMVFRTYYQIKNCLNKIINVWKIIFLYNKMERITILSCIKFLIFINSGCDYANAGAKKKVLCNLVN